MRRARVELSEVSGLLPLSRAARRSAKASPHSPAALRFLAQLEDECSALKEALNSGLYRPKPFKCFTISDPKPRQICAAPFRDRVVHHSLCAALAPRLERYAHPHSFACRVGLGTHAALDRAQALTRGARWALKLDVHHFFERAEHARLLGLLARLIKGRAVLELCERVICHAPPHALPGRGLPIGNLTSQHFANLYLTPLDHWVTSSLGCGSYVRYMDDLLFFSNDRDALKALEREVAGFLRSWGLSLKPSARQLCPISEGVPFLGFRLWPHHRRLDGARRRRLHRRLRSLYQSSKHRALSPEEQAQLQLRLSAAWAWAEKGGGLPLWASWHAYRATGSLLEPL